MPTLNWIGKEAVVNHHLQVPFHLLKDVPELSVGDPGSGNLIVQGDNLVALKALLPHYAGQVKCIYIDPPYNTGNEGWIYNDNVTSPAISAWLGQVVGKEGETLDRHDRWLCMMYPRLALLRQFLRADGAIFVSIGDDEIAAQLFLLDEIFGAANRLAIFSWKSRAKPVNVGEAKVKPQQVAEYVCVYGRSASRAKFHAISSGEARAYPFKNSAGRRYRLQTILKSNRGESKRETMQFEIAGYTRQRINVGKAVKILSKTFTILVISNSKMERHSGGILKTKNLMKMIRCILFFRLIGQEQPKPERKN